MNTLHLFIRLFILLLWLIPSPALALNILLVNDDGYESEGIDIMFKALTDAGHEVTMVAPKTDQSASGTGVLIQSGPLVEYGGKIELVNVDSGKWYLNGTPVDCVSAAINIVMAANPPDLVISGPNRGENVGYMATYSGTVGAALSAIQKGIPAIAVSVGMNWPTYLEDKSSELTNRATPKACALVVDLLDQLITQNTNKQKLLPPNTGLNINYPVMLPGNTDEPLGIKETIIDKYVTFSMVYGFYQASPDAVLPGMWPSYDHHFRIGETIPKKSEGKLFQDGYVTISVIDADLNSPKLETVFKGLNIQNLNPLN